MFISHFNFCNSILNKDLFFLCKISMRAVIFLPFPSQTLAQQTYRLWSPSSGKHGAGLHGGLAPIQPGRLFTPLLCGMPAGGHLAAGIPQALLLGWSPGTWGRNTEIHLLNEQVGLQESPPPFKEHKHDLFLARLGLRGHEPYRTTNCMS